jgi:hypothetical protein
MRAKTDLAKLYSSFQYRLIRIKRVFSAAADPRRAQLLAFSAIELDNLVVSTLREFAISSLRGARTASGVRVTTNRPFGAEEEIAAYMLSIVQVAAFQRLNYPARINRRYEVKIRDPRDTAKVFLSCGASNYPSLMNALALNTSLFVDLPTVRNFYAHRNGDTCRKVLNKARNMGVFGAKHADELMIAFLSGRPVSVFEEWLNDAELFFYEATQ